MRVQSVLSLNKVLCIRGGHNASIIGVKKGEYGPNFVLGQVQRNAAREMFWCIMAKTLKIAQTMMDGTSRNDSFSTREGGNTC